MPTPSKTAAALLIWAACGLGLSSAGLPKIMQTAAAPPQIVGVKFYLTTAEPPRAALCRLEQLHQHRPSRAALVRFLTEQYDAIQAAAERYPRCPAWLFAAAALLETSGGQSKISQNSLNLFNLKPRKDELFAGSFYVDRKGTKWAKYSSFEQSFDAFGCLITKYDLSEITPLKFAQSPFLAGYSQHKRAQYAKRLSELVEMYELDKIFKQ